LKTILHQIVEVTTTNPKAGHVAASTTATTGMMTWLEVIPSEIGKLATLIGIVLSLVLIYTNAKYHKKRMKVLDLDAEIKRLEKMKLEAEVNGH